MERFFDGFFDVLLVVLFLYALYRFVLFVRAKMKERSNHAPRPDRPELDGGRVDDGKRPPASR